jgi:putative salt-induced outer membrane protein YdiY
MSCDSALHVPCGIHVRLESGMKFPYAPTLALLLATASIASAEDVVTLNSGNRMTGEIRQLKRGELSFRIAGVGTVSIDWGNVVGLESPDRFYIELVSGEREVGTLAVSGGQLSIATDKGTRRIDANDVVRIGPATRQNFLDGLSGEIDAGFDFLSANDEIDWTINGDIERRTQRHLTEVQFNSLLRRRDSDTAQRRNHFEIGSRRFNRDRWFVLGQLHLEEDRELDLDSRVLLGAALGRTLSQSNRAIVSAYGGVDADREDFRGFDTDTVWELHGAIEWEWFQPRSDNGLDFRTIVFYAPDKSRTRVEAQITLRNGIGENFYWALRAYESYNSDPPEELEKSDTGVGLSIGREF